MGQKPLDKVPWWSKVKRAKIAPAVFDQAPSLAGDAGKITDGALDEAIRRLQGGDFSDLRASYPRGTGGGRSALETACPTPHYLDQGDSAGNRLLWWSKAPPPTGELSAYIPFPCEFHPVLRHKIDWELQPAGQSANENIASQFTFLDQPSSSVATVQRLVVTVMSEAAADSRTTGEHNVVVNAVSDDFQFENPNQSWPPLTIVFDQSQRAVGIEYGFADGGEISPVGVELAAYSSSGREIIRSRGGAGGFGTPAYIKPGEVFHRIGVQDWRGEIRFVVLSVTTDRAGEIDPGQPIRTPLLIYRVWHESFPPAVVKQGFTETAWSGGSTVSAADHPTEALPFRCDKSVVLLRGFRVAFLDGQARKITGLEIGFNVQRGPNGMIIAPSVNSGLRTSQTPAPARMVRIYYTLLAWDSEQVDAKATGISGGVLSSEGGLAAGRPQQDQFGRFLLTELRTPDPCGAEFCSQAFGAFTGFSAWFGERNVEQIQLEQGRAFPHPTDPVLAWPVTLAVTDTQADIFGYRWLVYGRLLTGSIAGIDPPGYTRVILSASGLLAQGVSRRTLPLEESSPPDPRTRRSDDGGFLLYPMCGVRPPASNPDHYLPTAEVVAEAGFARAVNADMAFPVLGTWALDAANCPVREIEVEVHSESYDGAILNWELGRGASLSGPDEVDCVLIGAAPVFGQVNRTFRTRGQLSVQHAAFETVPGIVAASPTRFGALQNLGPGPVLITSVLQGGTDAGSFSIRLGRAGAGDPAWQAATPPANARARVFALEEFYSAPPVHLLPGEVLLIGGRFYTADAGEKTAWLEFGTNTEQGSVTVELQGTTIAANAAGQWLPPRMNFGLQPIGSRGIRYALIASDGSTPLIITAIQIESTQAFSVLSAGGSGVTGTNLQVQPGASYQVPVIFQPAAEGLVSTRVLAQTNVGQLVMEVFGTGVASS